MRKLTMTMIRMRVLMLVLATAVGLLAHGPCFGRPKRPSRQLDFDSLPRPGERGFILDLANMIDPADEEEIRKNCDKLLTEQATPIIVVTIESMAQHGGQGMRIEAFAQRLFDQWEIGQVELAGKKWNTGILLLVSKGDRTARIELGGGWKHDKDELAKTIMEDHIIFHFKQDEFSTGIKVGVSALDRMARGLTLPTPPVPWWYYALIAGFIGLTIFTVVSLIRRGSGGWAWLFWAAVLSLVGFLLYRFLTRSISGGGGGGSFGGGFSGGGGATGSW